MKKSILLIPLLFSALFLSAQTEYPVMEAELSMSKGNRTAYTVLIENASKKDLEDRWCKYMKDYDAKGKKNKKSGEIFSDNAKIESMSNNSVDVYTKFNEQGDNVQLVAWFDLGGAYLSRTQHPDKVASAENMIRKFSREVIKGQVENTFDDQKDQLKELEKELKKLDDDKNKLENDIKDCEKRIEEAHNKIRENSKMQDDKKSEIDEQKSVVKSTEEMLKSYKN